MEVLIVDHASELPETFELFEKLRLDPRVRIIPYSGTFNYSAINNMAVEQAKGSIIGLINNDIDGHRSKLAFRNGVPGRHG